MSAILDKFIKMSELVSNTNEIVDKNELEKIATDKKFEYVNLNFSDDFNREYMVEKEGIENALVEADLAIAETGSVVLKNSSELFRRATALCENLYVVVPLSNIVESLEDTARLMKESTSQSEGAYIVFMTGASRTADIEMSLSLGVHGPQTMHIFIVKNL